MVLILWVLIFKSVQIKTVGQSKILKTRIYWMFFYKNRFNYISILFLKIELIRFHMF